MGRWSWSNRNTVEECLSQDIHWLSMLGYFCGFKSGGIEWKNSLGEVTNSIGIQISVVESFGGNYVRLQYTQTDRYTGEKTELDYRIELVTTPCNFGSVRHWSICPLVVNGRACRSRVAKLYLSPGGKYFGCRHCYNLTYRCQKEHDKRVDALAKNPDMLISQMKGKGLKGSLLTLKAYSKIAGRM